MCMRMFSHYQQSVTQFHQSPHLIFSSHPWWKRGLRNSPFRSHKVETTVFLYMQKAWRLRGLLLLFLSLREALLRLRRSVFGKKSRMSSRLETRSLSRLSFGMCMETLSKELLLWRGRRMSVSLFRS
eukprot:Rmarinus@m.12263